MRGNLPGFNDTITLKILLSFSLILFGLFISSCIGNNHTDIENTAQTLQTPKDFTLIPFESDQEEIRFQSYDGTWLAGQFDWVMNNKRAPLVFIIHHSGPVDRDSYQYMAAFLVPAGYSVFRFDKRGTGSSEGTYGCCEAEDALAAYEAAIQQTSEPLHKVFIIAQSIGTQILADKYEDFAKIHPPDGVILLSNLLEGEEILPIKTKIHIVISDQEPNIEKIGVEAANVHNRVYQSGASVFIAKNTEHTLFDITDGPIDWNDPEWPYRFSQSVMENIIEWLDENNE